MEYNFEKCKSCNEGYVVLETQIDTETQVEFVVGAECNRCGETVIVPNEPIENFGFSKKAQYSPKKMLHFQDLLAKKYRYKELAPILSSKYRNLYYVNLPKLFKNIIDAKNKRIPLFTAGGTQISTGFRRIVVGDYGAFIEIPPTMFFSENTLCKKGQEYRFNDSRYSKNVKYYWLTTKDDSDIKIYQQIKTVPYADYLPDMFYVSPYEVRTGETVQCKE